MRRLLIISQKFLLQHTTLKLVPFQIQSLGKKMNDQLEQIDQTHKKLQEELYQGHGLRLLSYDYFEVYKSSEQDIEDWKNGFSFKLESIRENTEVRRTRVINNIKEKLEK